MKEKQFLQSFDVFNEYLDLSSGKVLMNSEKLKTIGWFKFIGDNLCSLYMKDDELIYNLGSFVVNINENMVAKNERNKQIFFFKLFCNGELINKFEYQFDDKLLSIHPFDYIDEEDFNWGLFLENIINDKKRQIRLLAEV